MNSNDALINARRVRKWTQQKTADKANIPRTTLIAIEKGHIPNLKIAYRLAEVFDLCVTDIFLPSYVEKCNERKRENGQTKNLLNRKTQKR
jgi:DNA-binding XRE family transcriptional regulator